MKKILLTFISLFMLVGCTNVDSDTSYVKKLNYHDNFNILQLTDIHYNSATNQKDLEDYLTKVINEAEKKVGTIDLIEITGDTFMLAKDYDVTNFIKFIESFKIPYATIWGNHDREGQYNSNWLSNEFLNAEYSLYTEVDNDDVHERSNYVINLMDGDEIAWQIFNIDSGSYYYDSETAIKFTYDYIDESQFAWLDEVSDDSVPSIAYYHIVQKDFVDAWEAIEEGSTDFKYGFYKLETFGQSKYCTTTEQEFLKHNIVASFSGHCHANDFTFTTASGITYGLGVKSGKELYYGSTTINGQEMDLIGASVVTIKDKEGNFELSHLYLNENDNGDIIVWEEY